MRTLLLRVWHEPVMARAALAAAVQAVVLLPDWRGALLAAVTLALGIDTRRKVTPAR